MSKFDALRSWHRRRRAKLPWNELEAEAARRGCSPADIFFDRAGHLTGAYDMTSETRERSAATAREMEPQT